LAPKRAGLRVGASQLLAHHVIGMSASAPLFLHGLVPRPLRDPNSLPIGQFQKRCVSKIAQSMHLHLSIDLA
jgi:hypothetical protein